jgi:ribosomal-protein-alanine N-acetyltransferase
VAHIVSGEWEIENVVVESRKRRQGIGAALILAVMDAARERSAEKLLLEVRESNHAARGLYRKIGFVETGRRPNYYSAPSEDAILLTLNLH